MLDDMAIMFAVPETAQFAALVGKLIETSLKRAGVEAFATLVLAALVALSAWPAWVNAACVIVELIFFVGAIMSYLVHGALKDTTNQLHPRPGVLVHGFMAALIVGEIGGVAILVAGVVANWVA